MFVPCGIYTHRMVSIPMVDLKPKQFNLNRKL